MSSSKQANQSPMQKHPLIGIIGTEGAGKDTLADYLVANYGYTKYSMAQPIKEIAKIMFGWSDDQLNNRTKDLLDPATGIVPRDFFKWFGTEIAQFQIYSRFPSLKIPPREMWVECMTRSVIASTTPVIIPDIRFIHEANAVKSMGGILVHLSTPTVGDLPPASAMYDIPELINPSNGWLDSNLINPRINIPDFHSRINQWFSTSFTGCNLVSQVPATATVATTGYDTSNLSLYI
jgi:hypothetical protein